MPHESFALALEHRVEMSDQQQSPALRPLVLGEQVSRAPDGIGQRDPAGLESHRQRTGARTDVRLPDTREIESSAADVHRLLEKVDLFSLVRAHVVADSLLGLERAVPAFDRQRSRKRGRRGKSREESARRDKEN